MVNNNINTAFIGFGSNLDNPEKQISKAYNFLKNHNNIKEITISSLYETRPMGVQNQDNFINSVAKIKTNLNHHKLHNLLIYIEKLHKKRTIAVWGPRTLDLDLLSYESVILNSKKLTLPHPGVEFRNFVIIPWYEIDQEFILPNQVAIKDLYETCDKNIRKICTIC